MGQQDNPIVGFNDAGQPIYRHPPDRASDYGQQRDEQQNAPTPPYGVPVLFPQGYDTPTSSLPGYGQPVSGQGNPPLLGPASSTNGLAIAALVLSLFAGFIAIPFGHVARSQIRRTGQQGGGMALAGLIIGYISLAATVVVVSTLGYFAYVVNRASTTALPYPSSYSTLPGGTTPTYGGSGLGGTTTPYPSPTYSTSPTYPSGSSSSRGSVTVSGADSQGFINDSGARCNASDLAVAIARTQDSDVTICTTGSGGLYYRGARRSDGASLEIEFPTRSGNGFVAANGNTTYVLTPSSLTVTGPDGIPAQGDVLEYWAQ